MRHYYTLIIFVSIAFIRCDDDLPSSFIQVNSNSGINLRNPQPGDQSKYLMYESSCSENFQFTGDTLLVEVVSKDDTLYLKESYTSGSSRERTTEHAIFPENGYVLVPQRFNSEFLFFYGNDTIFLDRPADVQLIQSGCQLLENSDPFIGESIGSIDEFQFGLYRVNDKKSISCVPGFFDIDAYIFYADHMNAIHIIRTGLEENNIVGFVAIE